MSIFGELKIFRKVDFIQPGMLIKTLTITQFFKPVKHNYLIVILVWVILTIININKAFHIDDTFHLTAAEYIKTNPLKPMSGLINWIDVPTPLYTHNQPPLFFYFIALFSGLFGNSEISLHLLESIFTFFALYYFYKTASILALKNIRTLLIVFAFCPALIINQNVMTDVPILALIMGSTYFIFKAKFQKKLFNYSISSLLIGLGLLIKYSVLPLLIVILIIIIIRKEYKFLIVLFIPILLLSLWSYWNYLEYGGIHILDRPKGSLHSYQFFTFMACLGSISAFSISFIYGTLPFKITERIIYLVLSLFITSILLFSFGAIPEQRYAIYLNYLFIVNGLIISILLVFKLAVDFKSMGFSNLLISDDFIIFIYLISMSMFMILFAPFIATRHILLIIPYVILLGNKFLITSNKNIMRLTVSTVVILGLLLGVSDWVYADYYRKMAAAINLPKDRNIWTVGHWGWQWYSQKNGMLQYDMNQSKVRDGDYLVYPGNISNQNLGSDISYLIGVDKKWKAASVFTFFSGNNYASLYYSDNKAPWTLSNRPIDTIFICKIGILKNDNSGKILPQ